MSVGYLRNAVGYRDIEVHARIPYRRIDFCGERFEGGGIESDLRLDIVSEEKRAHACGKSPLVAADGQGPIGERIDVEYRRKGIDVGRPEHLVGFRLVDRLLFCQGVVLRLLECGLHIPTRLFVREDQHLFAFELGSVGFGHHRTRLFGRLPAKIQVPYAYSRVNLSRVQAEVYSPYARDDDHERYCGDGDFAFRYRMGGVSEEPPYRHECSSACARDGTYERMRCAVA